MILPLYRPPLVVLLLTLGPTRGLLPLLPFSCVFVDATEKGLCTRLGGCIFGVAIEKSLAVLDSLD